MTRTRVKICGLTTASDIQAAVAAGADAVGFVLYPPSPRAVTAEQAAALCKLLPPFVTAVGLFVDEDPSVVEAVLEQVPLDLLQFHGDEDPRACAAFGRRWIKALRMRPGIDLRAQRERYVGADGLLLDTFQPGRAGGTGARFDWERIPSDLAPEIVLAGGLDAANVACAIERVKPYGVDVSGGVEATKGVKDAALIFGFMQGVRDGDKRR
ncbi:phosphoribosylanthranilate isomerase [Thiorhodococcus mannitoliphagus]|uniref:N-(5'-phosphoribosyl)anthranilate isomerase n=1 Tax=Thiorhodococcus mannitoliphagus TaxID=329406 RepID=A0A6P1DWP2_9GAMM|nr:phosphoribosylanthranilate isomerase [Thiorhodococcus mannitoliphagus]NEX20542.1 phosphoribosylanthranilate isomerase [Thiorhodococcus mannitoliphagus]